MKNSNIQQFSSMHTHTTFCDGRDDVETMCRAAYEKKLYAIGFSAHAPISKKIEKKSNWHLKEEQVERYIKEILDAKERWKGKLEVFLGFEADYIKGRCSPLDNDITSLNLDYIIGSVHYLYPPNGSEPFTVDGSAQEFEKGVKEGYNGDAYALMHSYYDAVAEMITAGGFDILGHLDILKKNSQGKNYWTAESELSRQKEIANLLASNLLAGRMLANSQQSATGIVVEVNTGGLNRKKVNEVYPSPAFLRIIRELNLSVIITADAHCAKDINGNYDTALDTLICANFNEHVLFKGKHDNVSIWQKEKIIKN